VIPIFAQEGIPVPALASSQQAVFFFCLAGALYFLIQVVVGLSSIAASWRRKPSIEAEFATKKDLRELEAKVNQDIGKIQGTTQIIFQKIDHMASSIAKSMADIQRDLGRLEGTRK
jgi:hypothetical protein